MMTMQVWQYKFSAKAKVEANLIRRVWGQQDGKGVWQNQSENKFSKKNSRVTMMQTQLPVETIFNPFKDILIVESYPIYVIHYDLLIKISF